jgi:hypothetical protein
MKRTTEKELQEIYDRLNKSHFQGHLPRFKIRVGYPKGEKPELHADGSCKNEKQTIYIARKITADAEDARRLMLHEMCHVGDPTGEHGNATGFESRMLRLKDMGETWIEEKDYACILPVEDKYEGLDEAGCYILNGIEDATMESRGQLSLREVLRFLSRYLKCSSQELRREYPWIPARWREAKNEAKSLYTAYEEGLEKLDHLRKTQRRGH